MKSAIWLLATCLPASAFAASPFEHDVSLGLLAENTAWFAENDWYQQLETSYRISPASANAFSWSGVAGFRHALTGRPRFPLELFFRLELLGRLGAYYEPTCGFELGASGLAKPSKALPGFPDGAAELQAERTTLLYVSAVASPIRLVFGPVRLSVAEFHLGSTVGGAAAINRVAYLKLEYRL